VQIVTDVHSNSLRAKVGCLLFANARNQKLAIDFKYRKPQRKEVSGQNSPSRNLTSLISYLGKLTRRLSRYHKFYVTTPNLENNSIQVTIPYSG